MPWPLGSSVKTTHSIVDVVTTGSPPVTVPTMHEICHERPTAYGSSASLPIAQSTFWSKRRVNDVNLIELVSDRDGGPGGGL
eukprot:261428-Chlamydomonas_euryale.AAC.1